MSNFQTFSNIGLAVLLALAIITIFFLFGLIRPLGAFALGALIIFVVVGVLYTIFNLKKL